MARTRLQYDEARKHLQYLQQKMAELEDRIAPGQSESDKDRLLLIQEKEQLLRELRSIAPRSRSKPEMETVRAKIQRLEQDLSQALEASNRTIADRLKLHEEKQILLQSMRQALRNVALLEGQLRSLSASTLSMSSSSSLGSLSTSSRSHASSKVIKVDFIYCQHQPFPINICWWISSKNLSCFLVGIVICYRFLSCFHENLKTNENLEAWHWNSVVIIKTEQDLLMKQMSIDDW